MTTATNGGSYSPPNAREITVKGGEAKITLVESLHGYKKKMIEGAFRNYRDRHCPPMKMMAGDRTITIWGASDEELQKAIEWLELKPLNPKPAVVRSKPAPIMRDRRMPAGRIAAAG